MPSTKFSYIQCAFERPWIWRALFNLLSLRRGSMGIWAVSWETLLRWKCEIVADCKLITNSPWRPHRSHPSANPLTRDDPSACSTDSHRPQGTKLRLPRLQFSHISDLLALSSPRRLLSHPSPSAEIYIFFRRTATRRFVWQSIGFTSITAARRSWSERASGSGLTATLLFFGFSPLFFPSSFFLSFLFFTFRVMLVRSPLTLPPLDRVAYGFVAFFCLHRTEIILRRCQTRYAAHSRGFHSFNVFKPPGSA